MLTVRLTTAHALTEILRIFVRFLSFFTLTATPSPMIGHVPHSFTHEAGPHHFHVIATHGLGCVLQCPDSSLTRSTAIVQRNNASANRTRGAGSHANQTLLQFTTAAERISECIENYYIAWDRDGP